MIKLGDKVKDKLTGFNGTAIARAEYLYGCVWVCIVPEELHDSKPVEDVWFDEERLELIVAETKDDNIYDRPMARGGPTPSMPKMNRPKPYRG